MKQVHMARKRGERIEVTFDEKGQPEGKYGDELMSWIGVPAREHVPIWIQDWRSRDLDGLKEIIWKETVTSFTDFVTKDSVWTRPQKVIDNYPNIEEDDWVKFVQYRTSSQFQQLSDRGSEIRTNNKYTSRGGPDGYRKLNQETGKWEKRDELWLDSRTGKDGELKDPSCQKVSELIMQYNKQESQCTFKSVGTTDVLTQALSKPEHPERIRGQSKKMRSRTHLTKKMCQPLTKRMCQSLTNTIALRLVALFKKKQPGVSDPPTMPVDSQECKLYIFDELHSGQLLIAFGRAWMKSLPTDTVHGIPLGEGNV
ncbi:hypothetical protein TIFTF001_049844 [Ficus carica]|uniref:Uncharacterized protein n=1 Tax=Ficus carica TaxID=3494 RepID=A0AA88CJG6_FICCA|nr:hypothetical protein TIFTF001_049836 [Ficus carica]GMN18686.1 hypothetical protein TIFTF001_049837 [Ficus carica]GMN18708.1 hypothetical protein TIFTF001_049843 [Ficus carica]GMN18715.1 hypothetical protein TIFTF001_049844 [Ficus carica]